MKGRAMVHLLVVCEFVHHGHLHELEWKPLASAGFEDKLYDFTIVEVATWVWLDIEC
jgi:hypothetical protein